MGWGKYCSVECRHKSQFKGKFFRCEICDKQTYRMPSKIKHSKSGKFFCSKSCQTKWRNSVFVEDKHPNWTNGEKSYRNIMIKNGMVNKCHYCGLEDKRVLMVHHIDHNRQNNQKSNLISLCFNCHYLIHHDKEAESIFKKANCLS